MDSLTITVAIDAMGGDNAPDAVCKAAKLALGEMDNISVILFGPEKLIREKLSGFDGGGRLSVENADETIDMHEAPMLAVRKKPGSSMVKAMLAVKEGRAQAMLSAGSTGALLAGGMTRIGRISGISRPALATVLPGANKPFVLIDSGANVDCQPEYLLRFGLMGSIYAQQVLKVVDPTVRLVNIGDEAEKGNQLTKQAFALMNEQRVYKFAGNVEARDLPSGDADVVVADGFDGNIILKYTEGLAGAMMSMLKQEMNSGVREKLGAALLMPALRRFKKRLDYEEYGGAPLLGVECALIKAHGSSGPKAIASAIRQAKVMVEGNVSEIIKSEIERMIS